MKTKIYLLAITILFCVSCKNNNPNIAEAEQTPIDSNFNDDNYTLSFQSLEIKVEGEEPISTNIHSEITIIRDSSILITTNNDVSTFKYQQEIVTNDSVILECDSVSFIFYPNNEVRHISNIDQEFYVLYKNPI